MLLRPYSIKKPNHGANNTLSPKEIKKPTYIKFKGDIQKNTKSGRSLYSVQTQRQSSSLTNRRMLSHRKLISLSSLEHRQNLTDRKLPKQISLRENKFTISQDVQIQPKQVHSTIQPKQSSTLKLNQQPISLVAKFKRKNNDRLYTIQNIEGKQQNLQKALQIKENILKQFIDRFQQELREISLQKSHSTVTTKTLLTNRNFKNKNLIKQETTKKSHKNIITAGSLESHGSTMNLCNSISNKQNIPFRAHLQGQGQQKNKFQVYIKQLHDHKKKDQKIFIMKNHKRSLQSISISKIGETQTLLTNRVATKLEPRNNKMNLKQLFRHSKKYEPYLREGSTLAINTKMEEAIQQKQSKLQRSSSLIESFSKQNIELINNGGYVDCSSIEKMNQSSFISEVGRKSLLRHLEKQSAKLVREESKKSKKCLMKMKSVFPADFF